MERLWGEESGMGAADLLEEFGRSGARDHPVLNLRAQPHGRTPFDASRRLVE